MEEIGHGFLAFNDIQSDYYQLPSEDKEKIKVAEEKIREELKKTTIETTQDNGQKIDSNNLSPDGIKEEEKMKFKKRI